MSVNIIPGSIFTNSLTVTGNTTVGGEMTVGGNLNVCGELVTNSITVFQTFTISIESTSNTIDVNGNGVDFDINICGDTVTQLIKNDYWGNYVSTLSGLTADIALTSLGNTVNITQNGNGFNFESTPVGLPPATNYGNYIYWDGNAYVVGNSNIVIGASAGLTNQASNAIALGIQAGLTNQRSNTVALGNYAGQSNQNSNAVAVGINAGTITQGSNSVAIGSAAGSNTQSSNAVAIGSLAGQVTQSTGAVALGYSSGFSNQGANAVAIGSLAGLSNQAANSIVLNGLGSAVNAPNTGFFVAPIRNVLNTNSLVYNPSTYEITYTNVLNTAAWANFPAISNVDIQNNRLISSTGEVTISGKTVIQGASISDTVGPFLVLSNDTAINTSVYTSIGYNFVKLQIWGGGGRSIGTNTGGAGAYIEKIIDLTSSPVLNISIGGVGQPPNPLTVDGGLGGTYGNGNGGNGGGGGAGSGGAGGGGATTVRSNATIVSIAGGGGGAGNSTSFAYGGNAQQDGYSFFGGSGKGASSNTVGAGGSATGYNTGSSGSAAGNPPTAFGSGGPSVLTGGRTGGGGGGGGWAGGGGGTAQAGGGGGSSYLVGTGNIFPSSTVYGQATRTDSRIQAGSANMSGGVIATFYSSAINVVAPVLRVTGGPIMAPEFGSFATSTDTLASNASSNVFDFLGEPGVYECVSYSCDANGYLTSSKIGVNYIGQAFVMMSANYPTNDNGLDVSITNPLTYTLTNNTANTGMDLSNIVTKYTKVG